MQSWDERFGQADLAYGDGPNDFLAEQVGALTPGNCLCIAEGQGRNAVWLASQGFAVTAMDQSPVGMARARALAARQGVALATETGDLSTWDLGEARWDNIVSIFGHLPAALRRDVHARVVKALKPGGTFLLEAYTPEQIDMPGRGGPDVKEMLADLATLREELVGLDFVLAREIHREVNEGLYHHGLSAVVQIVARKPAGE
ncbi:class I SAM-dependent methyltransferase [Sphingobium lignivorans]|uniref:SAM-dependent methyltransferase n=1 Tax=Sphingobium lignivorans TaxID=2735886 RepID=A0ABR6NG99_9SPHN|nr:class I SAM-dependent methyltransferase [Sphingobium lignivorans]MBB5986106.1 SAM-dependent methyltransferase [Sphingobium lignivorans]